MTVYRTCLCTFIMMICFTSQAHAIWDLINGEYFAYKKRCNQIQKRTITVLSRNGKTWHQPDIPARSDHYLQFYFFPVGQGNERENFREEFFYIEVDYTGSRDNNYSSAQDLKSTAQDWYDFNSIQEELRELNYFKDTKEEIAFEMIHKNLGQRSQLDFYHVIGRIRQIGPKKFQGYFYYVKDKVLTEEEKKDWLQKIYDAQVNF